MNNITMMRIAIGMIIFALISLTGLIIYVNTLPEKVDYALAIDGESQDEYLGEFILKSKIYDFSYKIIDINENVDDYKFKNLVLVSDTSLEFNTLTSWLKKIDPENLIADINQGNGLRPLVPHMNIFCSTNLTSRVEFRTNRYEVQWSFIYSWLKNYEHNDLEETMFEVIMDGLVIRTNVGSTGVQFWRSINGHYNTFWSVYAP